MGIKYISLGAKNETLFIMEGRTNDFCFVMMIMMNQLEI